MIGLTPYRCSTPIECGERPSKTVYDQLTPRGDGKTWQAGYLNLDTGKVPNMMREVSKAHS